MRYIILGTAGHIDHGKSSLVKALTGNRIKTVRESEMERWK
jgi:selenocysteine-specific elongation factor